MIKKAIILSAGRGRRMGNLTKKIPKCLLRLQNKTLIEILISKLRLNKIKDILIVTGYKSKKIKERLGKSVRYLKYPFFNTTNNLHTLLFSKKELNQSLLCLFSDVVVDKRIIKILSKAKGDICLAIDSKTRLKGTMRIQKKGNRILDVGSHIKPKYSNGNFIGFSKFSKKGCELIKKSLDSFKYKNFNSYYTEAIRSLIRKNIKVNCIDVKNYYWSEIDTIKDYKKIQKIYR